MRGEGTSEVAVGRYLLGLLMIGLGVALFLEETQLAASLSWSRPVPVLGVPIVPAFLLAPIALGLVLILIAPQMGWGWLLMLLPSLAFAAILVERLQGRILHLPALDIGSILVLVVSGAGLFLSSIPFSARR